MLRLENIKNAFKSELVKTRVFFQGDKWKEAIVFSFFVLLAFTFWLLKSLQQEYEITISIPIKYKHIPANIAFNSTPPQNIHVRIKDKGSVLLNYTFGNPLTPLEINMKEIDQSDNFFSISKKDIEGNIQKQLIATTSLENTEPQQIHIGFSKRVHKEIPVLFNGFIHIAAGFQKSKKITINPSSVNAYASTEALKKISNVSTEFTEIQEADHSITKVVSLERIEGIKFEPTTVTITIPIEEYTEKSLVIPVDCTDVPPMYTARIFPQTVKVICSVPLSKFKDLSEDLFKIEIPYKLMQQNISGSLPVKLTKKPDWIQSITISPEKVEFILEQNLNYD